MDPPAAGATAAVAAAAHVSTVSASSVSVKIEDLGATWRAATWSPVERSWSTAAGPRALAELELRCGSRARMCELRLPADRPVVVAAWRDPAPAAWLAGSTALTASAATGWLTIAAARVDIVRGAASVAAGDQTVAVVRAEAASVAGSGVLGDQGRLAVAIHTGGSSVALI